mmetsp:Transcript_1858/g.5115  ORF Transcript_1858/g.5115 Transcript_1858/m.5115 type:complete len:201 (+) Transcript_1858:424-1026(+)
MESLPLLCTTHLFSVSTPTAQVLADEMALLSHPHVGRCHCAGVRQPRQGFGREGCAKSVPRIGGRPLRRLHIRILRRLLRTHPEGQPDLAVDPQHTDGAALRHHRPRHRLRQGLARDSDQRILRRLHAHRVDRRPCAGCRRHHRGVGGQVRRQRPQGIRDVILHRAVLHRVRHLLRLSCHLLLHHRCFVGRHGECHVFAA